jgi:hypothetical protein
MKIQVDRINRGALQARQALSMEQAKMLLDAAMSALERPRLIGGERQRLEAAIRKLALALGDSPEPPGPWPR